MHLTQHVFGVAQAQKSAHGPHDDIRPRLMPCVECRDGGEQRVEVDAAGCEGRPVALEPLTAAADRVNALGAQTRTTDVHCKDRAHLREPITCSCLQSTRPRSAWSVSYTHLRAHE